MSTGHPESPKISPASFMLFSNHLSPNYWELKKNQGIAKWLWFKGGCPFEPIKIPNSIGLICRGKAILSMTRSEAPGKSLELADNRSASWCFTLLPDASLCSHLCCFSGKIMEDDISQTGTETSVINQQSHHGQHVNGGLWVI